MALFSRSPARNAQTFLKVWIEEWIEEKKE